jgi:hypothetical protein
MSKRHRGFVDNYKPRAETLVLIERVKAVLAEYADHLPLTIRQIFYRLVGTGKGYEKTEKAYDRLGEAIGKARRAALIDFAAIRDDGAIRNDPFGYSGVDQFLATVEHMVGTYRLDRQIGQPMFTILGCEAGGMIPQLARLAGPLGVPVISGGGFDSITAKHDLAQEIARHARRVRFLHVGDYDPSGKHMFSALDEDVRAFLKRLNPDADVISRRVAVLPEHTLPRARGGFGLQTAPKKTTDNRSFEGIGDDPNATVQAEALDPADLADLVRAALLRDWDANAAERLEEREAEERERLQDWLASGRSAP